MPAAALYIVFGLLLTVIVVVLWRYWATLVDRTPEEDAYERRLTALNERQANRYSDDALTSAPNEDDSWAIMVERGRRSGRRDRYAGDLGRRTGARRKPKERP